jgi:cytoskeletal protein CcmA (bactofilin family)
LSSRRPASKVATAVPAPPEGKLEIGPNGQRSSVVLGPRDRLVGQLYIEGDLRVSGTVDGALEATGDIEIAGSGKVSGAVTAYNRLVVGSDASLVGGDVRVARLTVEDGATFTGRVSMGKHQATVPAEPEPASAEPVAQPVAELPVAASKTKATTDDFSTPRASAGWSKRRKGR